MEKKFFISRNPENIFLFFRTLGLWPDDSHSIWEWLFKKSWKGEWEVENLSKVFSAIENLPPNEQKGAFLEFFEIIFGRSQENWDSVDKEIFRVLSTYPKNYLEPVESFIRGFRGDPAYRRREHEVE